MAHNEGLTWLARRTGQFRYSVNGQDQWVQPLSVYMAGEAIQRGQPVSIVVYADTQDSVLQALGVVTAIQTGNDNLAVLTRSDRHTYSIGFAMETVQAGALFHVLSTGRICYLSANNSTEYWPAIFTNISRGVVVYAGPTAGSLTFDQVVAVTGGRNLIQLGSISNTIGTGGALTQVDIEVSITGDGRGPLDNTQFELNLGEVITYTAGIPPICAISDGSIGSAGTAIRASNDAQNRSNVIGFMLNAPQASPFAVGSNCLFLRKGRLRISGGLIPGARYYLGNNGAVTSSSGSVVYPNILVEIGTAISTTELIVDVSMPLLGIADYPLGTIRSFVPEATPDLGYLSCDGIIPPSGWVVGGVYAIPTSGANLTWYTLYLPCVYPQYILVGDGTNGAPTGSFKILTLGTLTQIIDFQKYYSQYVADPARVITSIQDSTVPTGYFKVPWTLNGATGSPYEIAAYTPEWEPLVPITDRLRSTGTLTSGGVVTLDLTPFTLSGPQNSGGMTLDQFIPELYVTTAGLLTKVTAIWTLSGTTLTGTASTYGSVPYILVVYKPEALARYQESTNILSLVNVASGYAINSTALINYLANNGSAQTLTLGANVTGSLVKILGAIQFGDNTTFDGGTFQSPINIKNDAGGIVVAIDNTIGNIAVSNAQTYPTLNTHLVNKTYADAHDIYTSVAVAGSFNPSGGMDEVTGQGAVQWTSGTSVHGILMGAGGNFDADMLDERHVGGWGWASDTAPNFSGHMPLARSAWVPEITSLGTIELGSRANFYLTSSASKPAANTIATFLALQGTSNNPYLQIVSPTTSLQALQIGSALVGATVNLIATGAGLQVTSDAGSSVAANTGTFTTIKASAFQTVSSISAKTNVVPFVRSGLEIIKGTEIVKYKFKSEDRLRVGFIAEWTDELLSGPHHDENDIGTTLGVALKAIQELAEDNDLLKKEIAALKVRLL